MRERIRDALSDTAQPVAGGLFALWRTARALRHTFHISKGRMDSGPPETQPCSATTPGYLRPVTDMQHFALLHGTGTDAQTGDTDLMRRENGNTESPPVQDAACAQA